MSEAGTSTTRASSLNRRQMVFGAAFLGAAAVAAARQPRSVIDLLGDRKLENVIPQQVGPWSFHSKSGLVIPPQDQLSDQLYAQLLTRVYTNPDSPPIMLLVAQGGGQTGVLQVHRPEVCYPAGGFVLMNQSKHQVGFSRESLDTVAFTAAADSRVEQLIYWTRVGRELPDSWAEQRWAVAEANLKGQVPDAVLVRISTISPDRKESLALLDSFTRTLLETVSPATRKFLVGPDLA